MYKISVEIMKKIYFLGVCFLLLSCNNKEVLLPKGGETIISDVQDHSPIYFFFKTEDKDTLIEVNKKNAISSTNWLFNIDKRLPLKLVIPEIKKLQKKKKESAHESGATENHFTYMDSVMKTLAFLPFTDLSFKYEKPDIHILHFYFDKNDLVHFNDLVFSKNQLQDFINKLPINEQKRINFSFDKSMSFEQYIQTKILIWNLKIPYYALKSYHKEYIY